MALSSLEYTSLPEDDPGMSSCRTGFPPVTGVTGGIARTNFLDKSWVYLRTYARTLRVIAEFGLLVTILALLLQQSNHDTLHDCPSPSTSQVETPPGQSSFETLLSLQQLGSRSHSRIFVPQPEFGSQESFSSKEKLHQALAKWPTMMPTGRGAVRILSPDEPIAQLGQPRLPHPYTSGSGPITNASETYHVMAVYHQLHCLSAIMASYGLAVVENRPPRKDRVKLVARCIDKLRQAILCGGDTTLDGDTGHDAGEGWGGVHQCRDMDGIKRWVEGHAALVDHVFPDTLGHWDFDLY
ncbi:protein of unknown function (DUF3328) domain containing protein [Rhypophila sp. PSN 637]